MFNILEKVVERLDRVEDLLSRIVERQPLPCDDEGVDEAVLPLLPCESREALQELNTLLESSSVARKKLVQN